MMPHTFYDVLVIGGGVAGFSAAISAAEAGFEVLLISKADKIIDSNTSRAQGGIVGPSPQDSPSLLRQDIIKAGAGLCYPSAVQELAQEGPPLVESFLREKCGISFTSDAQGIPNLGREAAHSVRRIYHKLDSTGKAIQDGLIAYAQSLPKIRIQTEHMAVDLITNCHHSRHLQDRYEDNRAMGAYVLDIKNGEVHPIFATRTVLATGGIGKVFKHSSNPDVATGDGIAMAYRAGISIINAEFVQFHPTSLYHRDFPNFLISEALRGEGARLLNKDGEAFMERYHPQLKDLAPRNEVSRAIYEETESRGENHVFLDATGLAPLNLAERFPHIHHICLNAGIDIQKEPIPVVPAAHYFCGGIKANLKGETSLEGLYALGETACTGVHGANRLASISLLEGLYSGLNFGKNKEIRSFAFGGISPKNIPEWIAPDQEADPAHIHNDLSSVQGLMWNYVGIARTRRRLQRALADLNYLNHRIDRFYREARPSRALVEMRNAALTATVITQAASQNSHSLGCHYLSKG